LVPDEAALAILRLLSTAKVAPNSMTMPNAIRNADRNGNFENIPNAMNTTAIVVSSKALRVWGFGAKADSFLFLSTSAWTDLISLSQASLHANPTPLSLAH
jgi:hypothetical protein